MTTTQLVEIDAEAQLAAGRREAATKLVFFGVVAYLIIERMIPDEYVLPIDMSIRVNQLVLLALGLFLVLATSIDVRPFPMGIVGVLGLLTVLVLLFAPFVNALGMDDIEASAAQRGVVNVVLFTTLFVAVYYVAVADRRRAGLLVMVIVGLTIVQATLGVYEAFTGNYVRGSWDFLRLGFLIDDPNLERTLDFGRFRAGGDRPTATAAHPIVLSASIALATLLILAKFPTIKRRNIRIALLPAIAVLLAAMFALHTRTGFVILAVGGLVTTLLVLRHHADTVVRFALAGLVALVAVVAILPGSARAILNLFARIGRDGSVGARTSDYELIPELVAEHPYIGLGFMTRQPTELILDNSYLDSLIEFGVIGLGIVLAFLIGATARPLLVSIRESHYVDSPVLIAGVAGGVALLVGMATFDALKFHQFFPTTLVLLALGLATADRILRNASRDSRAADVTTARSIEWTNDPGSR